MNFIDTSVDDQNLYLLLNYITGVELFQAIRDIGSLLIQVSSPLLKEGTSPLA
jgi:hypothetical protein